MASNKLSASFKSQIALIAAVNLLPLAGVLFLKWDVFGLLFFYCLETLIIAFFNTLTMAKAARSWKQIFGLPLVLIHTGFFTVGPLLILCDLFLPKRPVHGGIPWDFLGQTLVAVWPIALMIVIYQGIAYLKDSTKDRTVSVYARALLMVVSLVIGGTLSLFFGNSVYLILIMIAIKTAAEIAACRYTLSKASNR